jgi:uncharacterized SAM-dependent methyltransferase
MTSLAPVMIHASQFPAQVRRELRESLRTRRVSHKFHYDSVKQTQQWLALHQACSPSRQDPDCAAVYEQGFAAAAASLPAGQAVQVIGLGCGGGQKDTRLLRRLRDVGKEISYLPVDVSTAMVLVARETASEVISPDRCRPLVCDLGSAEDLPAVLEQLVPTAAARLLTFFGMVPNFEPALIMPRLASLLRPGDHLLCSANLAPGPNYTAGVKHVLPQYDNSLTRDWLRVFLSDLGVSRDDGEIRFGIEDDPGGSGLKRIVADFVFARGWQLELDGETLEFAAGDSIRLFFSFRHTPERMRTLLGRQGLAVAGEWITRSEEEGVFLARRA